uniref:Uncharacterized protein n=1 Tax=Amphimedon queenslandica TaxID=400682 RepID=A0A1X7T774_AMPQE
TGLTDFQNTLVGGSVGPGLVRRGLTLAKDGESGRTRSTLLGRVSKADGRTDPPRPARKRTDGRTD